MAPLENTLLKPIELSKAEKLSKECDHKWLSDTQLWNAFRQGEEGAFIEIYNQYFKDLCDFGIQFASISVVEDAVQDMFIDLRKKRDTLPDLHTSLRSFFFQCLKRKVFNVLKNQKKMQPGIVPEQRFEIVPHNESIIILNQEHKEKLMKLDRALTELSEKHREVIYYYFYQGMSYKEVQELLGFRDIKSARNLVYKVVQILRKNFLNFF